MYVRVKNRNRFPPTSNTNAPTVLAHDTLIMTKFLTASFRFDDLRECNIFYIT